MSGYTNWECIRLDWNDALSMLS